LRSAGAILLVSVPCQRARHDHHVRLARRGTRREAEALDIVARHRELHHLDGAAGETERHPHQRARAGPVDQIVGGGDEKALVRQFVVDLDEERITRSHGLAVRAEQPFRGRRDERITTIDRCDCHVLILVNVKTAR